MNYPGNRPCPASIAARFDAEASPRRPQLRESDPLARGHCVRGDSRAAAGARRGRRARPRTAVSAEPIGRHALVNLPCQVHDPELWFADDPAELEQAKALCGGCPARTACLDGALDRQEFAGVWGGQIFDRGRIVTHKRPRGRPRKGSLAPQRYPAWAESA